MIHAAASIPSSPRFHCLLLDFSVPLRHHGATLSRATAPTAPRSVHETVATSYRTLTSWSRKRRVVGKAEWLPGGVRGNNQRFVVTSLERGRSGTQALYEQLYCARGDMENRIKEQQLDLFADRTSAATMRANQLRLYWALFAAAMLEVLRQRGLAGTELAQAQFGTIRALLLKVAAVVRVSVRRVWVSLSSVFPRQELFAHSLSRLRAEAPG